MSDSAWIRHLKTDPYDDIQPSLLNSDDICRYASLGCLVKEFDENRLLPAGYKFRFLGKLIYWKPDKDGELERIELDVKKDMPIPLPANSIAYLHMHDEFRMPQYIAARFNLRITHVHQGLLLGTGPLVDPGFWGRILIPLHNLTNNNYSLMGGESIIHVEFTKLSMLARWKEGADPDNSNDKYKEFPQEKIVTGPDSYFKKASVLANDGVVSNLNPALQKIDVKLAEVTKLKEGIEGQMTTFRAYGHIALVAIAIALASLIYSGFNLVQSTNNVLQGVAETVHQAESAVEEVRSLLGAVSDIQDSSIGTAETQQDDVINGDVDKSISTKTDLQPETVDGSTLNPTINEEPSKSDDSKSGLKE